MAKFDFFNGFFFKFGLILALLIAVILIFIFWGNPSDYAVKTRIISGFAVVLVAASIGISSLIFQSLTCNKILTPSIIGLDSLYLLIQSFIVFIFGASSEAAAVGENNFLICVIFMIIFVLLLYKMLFKGERNIYFVLLLGIIFGVLFGALSSFFEVLIDPDEFMVVQGRMFASFNNINLSVLALAAIFAGLCFIYIFKNFRFLDPLSLGRETAINLGLNYEKIASRFMIIIAILVSISTALVGPITFLGLLTANLTYLMFSTHRHAILLPAVAIISVITLLGGSFITTHIFSLNTTISVVINFVGGIYFIFLILRSNKL